MLQDMVPYAAVLAANNDADVQRDTIALQKRDIFALQQRLDALHEEFRLANIESAKLRKALSAAEVAVEEAEAQTAAVEVALLRGMEEAQALQNYARCADEKLKRQLVVIEVRHPLAFGLCEAKQYPCLPIPLHHNKRYHMPF